MSKHHKVRDPKTGRWQKVDTENAKQATEGKFATRAQLEVRAGNDPADYAFGFTGRDENNAAPQFDAPKVRDDLAVGSKSPLRPRGAATVDGDEHARTAYGIQGALVREAAREGHRGFVPGTNIEADPVRRLTGAE